MKPNRLLVFLLTLIMVAPSYAADDEKVDFDFYLNTAVNIDRKVNNFINEYNKDFPPHEKSMEELGEDIKLSLEGNGTPVPQLMDELAKSKDRYHNKGSNEEEGKQKGVIVIDKKLSLKAHYRQKAEIIISQALDDKNFLVYDKNFKELDMFTSVLLMRFAKNNAERPALWMLMDTLRDFKLNDGHRNKLDRNRDYWYNAAWAAAWAAGITWAAVAVTPKIKGTKTFKAIHDKAKARFPQFFDRKAKTAGTSSTKPEVYGYLPSPEAAAKTARKLLPYLEEPSKNLPSPWILVKGVPTKTKAYDPDNVNVLRIPPRNNGGANRAAGSGNAAASGAAAPAADEATQAANATTENVIDTAKKVFVLRWLDDGFKSLVRHRKAIGTAAGIGFFGGGFVNKWLTENDKTLHDDLKLLNFDDAEVLPAEEMDRYIYAMSIFKFQCRASDLLQAIKENPLDSLSDHFFKANMSALNSLYNTYAFLRLLAEQENLQTKSYLPKKRIFDNGEYEITYSEFTNSFLMQRRFENSYHTDHWQCESWIKPSDPSKKVDLTRPSYVEVDIADALLHIEEARNYVMAASLNHNWNNLVEFDFMAKADAVELIPEEDILWDDFETEMQIYPEDVREVSVREAKKILQLSADTYPMYLEKMIADYKDGRYVNLPVFFALEKLINEDGEKVGRYRTPSVYLK